MIDFDSMTKGQLEDLQDENTTKALGIARLFLEASKGTDSTELNELHGAAWALESLLADAEHCKKLVSKMEMKELEAKQAEREKNFQTEIKKLAQTRIEEVEA